MSYDKTISADLYDQKWEDGTITITMKRGASVPVIVIKVTGAELTGSYTLSVKADAGAAEWSAAKTGELSGDSVVAYFTKPGAEPFFVDVVSGAWYESTVRYAAEAGLMAGTGDGRFSPEVTTTRGMIVTILHRMETGVSDQGTPSPGSRWPPSFTATPAARAAMCQLGQICPPMRMQRRSAPMPWAYAGAWAGMFLLVHFLPPLMLIRSTAPLGGSYAGGLISGTGPAALKPGGGATRAQAAAILVRFCTGAA